MAELGTQYEGEGLVGQGDAFKTLVRSIVGQQISVHAADSIWARFEACVGRVAPKRVAAKSEEDLRGAGFTRQKARYVRDIAVEFASGRLDPSAWDTVDDEAVIKELVALRGVGRWTAEMFLIFYLQRPDVLPLGDIGVQRAMGRHYGESETMVPEEIEARAECWRPWRSVATWHLWRSLDPLPVTY
jgi:DNA-3-methyladenine glycosylase II